MTTRPLPGLLPAMAVSCLAWFLYLGLAPGTPLTEATAIGLPVGTAVPLLMCVPLAFIWQGLFWKRDHRPLRRVATMLALCAGLMLMALGVHLTHQYLYVDALPWNPLGAQLAGILVGLLAWWLAGPRLFNAMQALSSRLRNHPHAMQVALVSGVVLLLAVPLDTDVRLADMTTRWDGSSISAAFTATQQHIYSVLKGVILWIPLGLLYRLANKQGSLKVWVVAGLAGFALEAAPLFSTLLVRDVLEVACAPLGIWIGVWLGNHTEIRATVHAAATAASTSGGAGTRPVPSTAAQPLPASDRLPVLTGAGWLGRSAALLLLVLAACLVWGFPRWELWLGAGLCVYVLALWKYPPAWLLVVPALLPVLNLAPSTGRFFFDEFDLLMVCTTAMALWHGSNRERTATLAPAATVAVVLFGGSYFISLLIGLLPLQPVDANAFSSYWSAYNSLRVAKGGLWALVLLMLLRWSLPWPTRSARQLLTGGMVLGLVSVILIGLRERWQFAGLFDLASDYRITASFSSMHTGGGHIEAYLVMAIPFLWLFITCSRRAGVRLFGVVVFLAAVYLTTTTIARGGVFALIAGLVVLGIGSIRGHKAGGNPRAWKFVLPVVLLLGAITVVIIGLGGEYFQQRLARVEQDAQTRLSHWSNVLAMMDDDWTTQAFGMGLGTFPVTYLYQGPAPTLPATYHYETEAGNLFLRLGAGGTLYMAQRVAVYNQRSYMLSMDLRSQDPGGRLEAPVCEKHLLDSFRCQWQGVPFPAGDNQWHHVEILIDSAETGSGNWLSRRPVELSLYNPAARTIVDIDNVSLLDSSGTNLIRNGDFSMGGDYWFFKTHEHLPWHIKNLWVQVFFEQGWLGLLTFCLLLAVLLKRLLTAFWSGDMFATTLLASVTGLLATGLVGSPFDAPRLATLFFTLLLLGAFQDDAGRKNVPRKPSQNGGP